MSMRIKQKGQNRLRFIAKRAKPTKKRAKPTKFYREGKRPKLLNSFNKHYTALIKAAV